MERFMHRENVLVECTESSSKSLHSNSEETDFKDVFGGPPRRFSMQEVRVRYSFGETVESEEDRATSPWIVLKEKPVFGGEDSGARRRLQGNDFYDDIFGGDESYSSPRTSDHRDRDNSLGSIPGSRIMSPNRPFPPKSDILGTSLPVQFSRPSKSTKQMELPAVGTKSPLSPSSSRYSHEAIQRSVEETRNENHPVFRASPLSYHDTYFSGEDIHSNVTFDQKGNVKQLIKETEIAESSNNENEFHFSIYKWAGLGLPMLLPLIGRNNCKSKDDNGNGNYIEPHSMKIVCEERDFRINEEKKDQQHYTEFKSGTKKKGSVFFGARGMLKSKLEKSLAESNLKEETENENHAKTEKPIKSELKPLHVVLDDEVELRGTIKNTEKKNMRTPTKAQSYENVMKNMKKNTGVEIDLNGENDERSKASAVTPVKSGVRGKVRDFVHRFSQEAESKPKNDLKTQSQSFRMKSVGIDRKEENEVKMSAAFETLDMLDVDKKPEVSVKVDEDLTKDEAQEYPFTITDNFSSNQDNTFSSEFLNKDSKISSEYSDDAFEDIFEVEELSEDHEKLAPSGEGFDDLRALDVKIQQWSFGKKGNIRSLLSTLQFVLWPESGWTPIPLMDLIEGNTVKRAYQKALLRLHPDKLQQKNAPSSHKYIAEKVFDILQEAWDHFNTLAPL